MSKIDRGIYLVLTDEVYAPLCSFCDYASCADCCSGIDCLHGLADHPNFPLFKADGDLEPGMDCWGFKPCSKLTVDVLADLVGIILANEWDEWTWIIKEDGTIKIRGRDSRKERLKV